MSFPFLWVSFDLGMSACAFFWRKERVKGEGRKTDQFWRGREDLGLAEVRSRCRLLGLREGREKESRKDEGGDRVLRLGRPSSFGS